MWTFVVPKMASSQGDSSSVTFAKEHRWTFCVIFTGTGGGAIMEVSSSWWYRERNIEYWVFWTDESSLSRETVAAKVVEHIGKFYFFLPQDGSKEATVTHSLSDFDSCASGYIDSQSFVKIYKNKSATLMFVLVCVCESVSVCMSVCLWECVYVCVSVWAYVRVCMCLRKRM